MPRSDPSALAAQEIVLASASPARRRLLEAAGLRLIVDPAAIDEAEMRMSLLAESAAARDVADRLAGLKAERVSFRHPGMLVLGADQVLECEDKLFEKPADLTEARAHLAALAGKSHTLHTALVVARDGAALWRHLASARLFMRPLSETFLDAYLAAAGESVLSSVGAYALEGLGAQLFTRIEGDYFIVLGLPLLPLLDFLRAQGVVPR
jgi:septum formation protein